MFYSQHNEDQWIVENLKLPEWGVFVDVGAYDGVNLSNTLHFENRGWGGLCIEADPRSWHPLLMNRRCQKFFGAAGNNESSLFEMNPEPTHSGFGRGGTPARVPVLPLHVILNAYGVTGIDLLSIDVEGAEIDVWKSGDFGSLREYPAIVIIEHDTAGLPSAEPYLLDLFFRLPYRLAHRTRGNLIFVTK